MAKKYAINVARATQNAIADVVSRAGQDLYEIVQGYDKEPPYCGADLRQIRKWIRRWVRATESLEREALRLEAEWEDKPGSGQVKPRGGSSET